MEIDHQSSVYALLSPESSPEQKFVGLYLIPKILSLEDEPGLRQLKKHLPWAFLGQLLEQGSDHSCLENGFLRFSLLADQMLSWRVGPSKSHCTLLHFTS